MEGVGYKKFSSMVPITAAERLLPDPPHGMEDYDLPRVFDDLGALSENQQEQLNEYKKRLRFEDEDYLRKHPEINCLISDFLGSVLANQPKDIRSYASEYFTNPNLQMTIEELLRKHQIEMKMANILKNS